MSGDRRAARRPGGREEPLLTVRDLVVRFRTQRGVADAVRGVSLDLAPGEALALVGESGSGKSTLLRAMAGLLAGNAEVGGSVRLRGQELLGAPERVLRPLRGSALGMIFQDPVNCLNPSMTIGSQLRRVFRLHRPDVDAKAVDGEVVSVLERVGIDVRAKLDRYPFEFSQGQLQRVMIAAACLIGRPAVLFADEPTTSLDVTTEAQVLELLRELRAELGMALVLVTHNLAVAAQVCDRSIVLYGGRVMEEAGIDDLFERPAHPYTRQLLRSMPRFPHEGGRIYSMPGDAITAAGVGAGCEFRPRCEEVLGAVCAERVPVLLETGRHGQRAACHRWTTPGGAEEVGVPEAVGTDEDAGMSRAARLPEEAGSPTRGAQERGVR